MPKDCRKTVLLMPKLSLRLTPHLGLVLLLLALCVLLGGCPSVPHSQHAKELREHPEFERARAFAPNFTARALEIVTEADHTP